MTSALLQDILIQPLVRDPRGRAQAVTREIAGKLAQLAASLEDRGLDAERVARFLMRCVFCFFAEDVSLLPKELFRRTLETARGAGSPAHVAQVLTSLWRTMDEGGMFGAELLHRFNGHFFRSIESLELERRRPGAPHRGRQVRLVRRRALHLRHAARSRPRSGGAPPPRRGIHAEGVHRAAGGADRGRADPRAVDGGAGRRAAAARRRARRRTARPP